MRVLLVVHGFPPETLAGTEVVTLQLALALQRRGHEVLVLYRSGRPLVPDYALEWDSFQGVPTVALVNRLSFSSVAQTYRNPSAEEAFVRVLDHFQPDVVHFQHLLHLSASLIAIARRRALPTVVTLNDYWFVCPTVQLRRLGGELCAGPGDGFECLRCAGARWIPFGGRLGLRRSLAWAFRHQGSLVKRLVKTYAVVTRRVDWRDRLRDVEDLVSRPQYMAAMLREADLVICPSQFLIEVLRSNGVWTGNLRQADQGTELSRFQGLERRPAGHLRLAFIGTLIDYKGPQVLVEAFNRLQGEPATLQIYGATDGPAPVVRCYEELLAKTRNPELRFERPFPNSQMGTVLAEIDVVVVPSIWYECSPMMIHEAFAAGVPVVASDLGAMRELIHDGADGLLFRTGDAADLAGKLRSLIHQPALLATLRRGIRPMLSLEESAAEHEGWYRQLVAARSGMMARPAGP